MKSFVRTHWFFFVNSNVKNTHWNHWLIYTFTVYIMDFFHFYSIEKVRKKMFKVNNGAVQNKCTMEKFCPKKTIVQYLIRIVHRGTWPRKYRICTIIRYPRVYIKWKHFFVFRAIDYFHFFCVVFRSIANCFFFFSSPLFFS